MRIVWLANFVTSTSGGLRTALHELGAGYAAARLPGHHRPAEAAPAAGGAVLLRGGLAERIPDPEGGMARKLRITEEGLRRVAAERDFRLGGLATVLKDWSRQELTSFAEGLAHFNASIEQ
ncbi:hypothetical protein [Nonomuraea sp. 10N515B]|uniref:hypothetical protein n=1 Tax=Nonomuraea sp. 10N515B TaxID=3457422 RepID=UPI003FCE919C